MTTFSSFSETQRDLTPDQLATIASIKEAGGIVVHDKDALKRALTSGNIYRLPVVFVTLLMDVSGSMTYRTVQLAFDEALPVILRQVAKNAQELQERPVVRIVSFSHELREVVSWCSPEDAMAALRGMKKESHGATRADLAIQEAIICTEEIKDYADSLNLRRGGSVIFTVTDGYLTDADGDAITYPKELVDDIADLQEQRHIGFMALGMGEAMSEQLAKLAPAVTGKDGTKERAVMYQGDYDNADVWRLFARFIANASYGANTDRAVEDVVKHAGFVVVSDD
jgi:uncharacterized protein YegL